MKPRLLDLYCGGGGASMGYHLAGFEVVGVDRSPQPHYPFEFHQADARDYPLDGFDAIHASPPCQPFSMCNNMHSKCYDDLDMLEEIRNRLMEWADGNGYPWVIENVPGAPLWQPIMLCGAMFGLRVYRHRHFESNALILPPVHPKHVARAGYGYKPPADGFYTVSGHYADHQGASQAMGIDWMNRKELAQAIPPAYTEWIGRQLMDLCVPRAKRALAERAAQLPFSPAP